MRAFHVRPRSDKGIVIIEDPSITRGNWKMIYVSSSHTLRIYVHPADYGYAIRAFTGVPLWQL